MGSNLAIHREERKKEGAILPSTEKRGRKREQSGRGGEIGIEKKGRQKDLRMFKDEERNKKRRSWSRYKGR